MAKVLLFLADGFEEVEALMVVDLLRRAQIEIDMVSVTGSQFVTGSHEIEVKADRIFEEANFSDADMLVLPGGMPGTKNLQAHEGLGEKLKEFHAEEKMIGAICAAPLVLGSNGILEGKSACCYPGYEGDLLGADVVYDSVCHCDNIITSRGLGTAIDFSAAIITHYIDDKKAEEIKKAIIYQQ